ncbi:MAG: Stp1/IreP family PP2C-type Ser/Thr phosphatase [Thermoleophilaceae bacterium]|nr:Stp1/IreP family PP2C-type Ser/Thr phosphatase [Thermoleophilaceae bacterium]
MTLTIADQAGLTDVGRQRSSNEDSFLESAPVFCVADGMGGARAGEVASRIAVETLADGDAAAGEAEARLADTARAANRRIYELAQEDDSRAGMGTTFTAVLVDGGDVVTGHVGDSRLYRLRDDALERLTRDHSLVEELVRRGELDPKEAESHPQRSIITRALGPEPEVEVETFTCPARAGDVYLVCSDGLTSMVSEERLRDLLRADGSLEEAAHRLVEAANDAGGKDNITVVLFRLADDGGAAAASGDTLSGQDTRTDLSAREVRAAAEADSKSKSRAATTRRSSGGRARRRIAVALAALVLAALLVGFYFGSREYYFLGTNDQGLVSLYRGLPYDLPLGVELYEQQYVSGVPAASIDPGRREEIIGHQLREEGDALDLMRDLEEGRLTAS